MFDPFAAALGALFRAPGSAAAEYLPPDGFPVPLRVIRDGGDTSSAWGRGHVVQATNTIAIQVADVARPVAGATVMIGAARFRLVGAPELDTEGLSWRCGAEPA